VCDPGYFRRSEGGVCIPCPADTFKDRFGNKECEKCRADSTSNKKTQLVSADDCLCNAGFFLYRSRFCRACGEFIDNCLECETRTNMVVSSNAALCTKAPPGYTINAVADEVTPNKCSGSFKFGDDVFPDELDISHCLENAVEVPVTGSLCQPHCKPLYMTKTPLPQWRAENISYCTSPRLVPKELKKDMGVSTCRQYCESLSDCYFFAEYTQQRDCSIWRAGEQCTLIHGVSLDNEGLDTTWHLYEGMSQDGFTFMCDENGEWSALELADKQSAIDFFQQCTLAPTTSASGTTPTQQATRGPGTYQPDLLLLLLIMVAAVLLIVVTVVIIIIIARKSKQKMERRDTTVVSDEEINEVFKKTDELGEQDKKTWMNGDHPIALEAMDDRPT